MKVTKKEYEILQSINDTKAIELLLMIKKAFNGEIIKDQTKGGDRSGRREDFSTKVFRVEKCD